MNRRARSFYSLLLPVLALAASWLDARPAAACKCALLAPSEAASQASAVFEGRVVEVADVQGAELPRRKVTLRVVRVWKGMQDEQAVVTTASDSAACGIAFAPDHNYVVYANAQDGGLSATTCGRTRLVTDADEDVKALGMGWTPIDPNKQEGRKPAAKTEPPARGGCAGCAVSSGGGGVNLLALLVPVGGVLRRVRRRSAARTATLSSRPPSFRPRA